MAPEFIAFGVFATVDGDLFAAPGEIPGGELLDPDLPSVARWWVEQAGLA